MSIPTTERTPADLATVRRLAQQQGATHLLPIDDRYTTFYRTVAGRVEAATALRDGDGWTLTSWTVRSVPRLPRDARRIS